MATEPVVRAERGMSVSPDVVFNTATDPNRASAWLPEQLRVGGAGAVEQAELPLRARWVTPDGWSAGLLVEPGGVGSAIVRLELTGTAPQPRLTALAEDSLANLAREVADNLNAG